MWASYGFIYNSFAFEWYTVILQVERIRVFMHLVSNVIFFLPLTCCKRPLRSTNVALNMRLTPYFFGGLHFTDHNCTELLSPCGHSMLQSSHPSSQSPLPGTVFVHILFGHTLPLTLTSDDAASPERADPWISMPKQAPTFPFLGAPTMPNKQPHWLNFPDLFLHLKGEMKFWAIFLRWSYTVPLMWKTLTNIWRTNTWKNLTTQLNTS